MKNSKVLKEKLSSLFSSKAIILYIWTYLTIMLIPLFISFTVFLYNSKTLKEEILYSNEVRLSNVADTIQSKINLMDDIINMYKFYPELLMLLRNDDGSIDSIMQRKTISDTLSFNSLKDSIASNLFVYSTKQHYVLGQGDCTSLELLEYNLKNDGILINNLGEFLSKSYTKQFNFIKQPNGTIILIYLNSLPYAVTMEVIGNFVFFIDTNKLQTILQEMTWNENVSIIITDNENNIITSTRTMFSVFDESFFRQIPNNTESIVKSSSGVEFVVIAHQDTTYGFKYLSLTPVTSFYARASAITILSLISFIICIILEISLISFFIWLNYRPLAQIISFIKQKTSSPTTKDEYVYIQNMVSDSVESKHKLEQLMEVTNKQTQKTQEQHNLLKLLLGYKLTQSDISIDKMFSYENFVVAYISIDVNGVFETDKDKSTMLPFIITNILNDLIENIEYFTTEYNEGVFVVIKTSCIDISIKQYFERLHDYLLKKMEILISIFLSDTMYNKSLLNTAYKQCMELYYNHDILSDNYIFVYGEMPKVIYSYVQSILPEYIKSQLWNTLYNKNFDMAKQILNNIFDKPHSKSLVVLQYLSNNLANMLSSLYEKSDFLDPDQKKEIAPIIGKILFSESFTEVSDSINLAIDQLKAFQADDSVDTQTILHNTILLINQNISNCVLNVSFVADKLMVSQSYLSKIFKKKYGIGMLDYINNRRIEFAKQLLSDENISIFEIAEKAGYSSVNTFIRVFKRYEGITPKLFKTNIM